jgi:hypothetical protein
MIKNKIIAFIKESENQKEVQFIPKAIIQNLKLKKRKNFGEKIKKDLITHLIRTKI